MGWYGELLVGFDLETTGTDPGEARIVSAAVVEAVRGVPTRRREWLADPGVPVPPETTAIHGITDERATTHGRPAAEVADEVAEVLAAHWSRGVPVVAYNAAFDLTLLAAELRRHGLASMRERLGGGEEGPVIDPYAMDRTVDPFREGKRTLEAVCVEYGVVLGRAHDAAEDALAAVRLAVAIAERYGDVASTGAWELHRGQAGWHAERAEGYRTLARGSTLRGGGVGHTGGSASEGFRAWLLSPCPATELSDLPPDGRDVKPVETTSDFPSRGSSGR